MLFLYLLPFLLLATLHSQPTPTPKASQFPKILWQYQQPDPQNPKSSKLDSLFMQNHRNYAKNYQIRRLNSKTVLPYIYNITGFEDDFDKLVFPSLRVKYDYVRFLIMSYYGGVWVDTCSFLVDRLDWLQLDRLYSNPHIVNMYGQQPNLLLFASQNGQKYFETTRQQYKYKYYVSPRYQLWFIAAMPNTMILRQFFRLFRQQLILPAQNETESKPYNASTPDKYSYSNLNTLYSSLLTHLLQSYQQRLNTQGVQLAVWNYQIWHIPTSTGPSMLQINQFKQPISALTMYTEKHLGVYNVSVDYFVHMSEDERQDLSKYYKLDFGIMHFLSSAGYKVRNMDVDQAEQYFCAQKYYVWNQSYLYHHLIRQSQQLPQIKITPKNRFYAFPCFQLRRLVVEIKLQQLFKPLCYLLIAVMIAITILIIKTAKRICSLRGEIGQVRIGGDGDHGEKGELIGDGRDGRGH